MRNRIIGAVLIVFGVLCLIAALGIKWYDEYTQEQAMLEIERRVRENIFYVSDDTGVVTDENVSMEELEDIISAVSSDQELAEVVTYKNVLDIPKIECQAYIGEGVSAYNLARGVGHHTETVKPGAIGNSVVCGHASRSFKCLFNRLEEMQVLDEFYVYDSAGEKHTYTIIRRFVASPGQLSILDNTDDGRSTMTIYTCTEGGTMRFVLVGTEFTGDGLSEFKKEYFGDRVAHMCSLNDNINVEGISELLAMRSTKRSVTVDDVTVNPGVVNLGIVGCWSTPEGGQEGGSGGVEDDPGDAEGDLGGAEGADDAEPAPESSPSNEEDKEVATDDVAQVE